MAALPTPTRFHPVQPPREKFFLERQNPRPAQATPSNQETPRPIKKPVNLISMVATRFHTLEPPFPQFFLSLRHPRRPPIKTLENLNHTETAPPPAPPATQTVPLLLLHIFISVLYSSPTPCLRNAVERHPDPLAGDLDPVFIPPPFSRPCCRSQRRVSYPSAMPQRALAGRCPGCSVCRGHPRTLCPLSHSPPGYNSSRMGRCIRAELPSLRPGWNKRSRYTNPLAPGPGQEPRGSRNQKNLIHS